MRSALLLAGGIVLASGAVDRPVLAQVVTPVPAASASLEPLDDQAPDDPAPTAAPGEAPAATIARTHLTTLLRTGHADPDWFGRRLSKRRSLAKLSAASADLRRELGDVVIVVDRFSDRFEAFYQLVRGNGSLVPTGGVPISVQIDSSGKIDDLRFGKVAPFRRY